MILGFLYYNTILLARKLGAWDLVPPAVAGWLHTIIFGAIGLILIWRAE